MADYEGEVVRIALLAGDEGVVRGKSFERCDIKGPAVLAPMGKTRLEHNQFDGNVDQILWEVDRPSVVGAIAVEDCTFTGCHFMGIGIAGPPELLARFRRD